MVHIMLALAQASMPEAGKGVLKQWFQTVLFNGLGYAGAHPILSGLASGVVLMVAMFAIRSAVWSVLKWVIGIPIAALKQTARPVVALWRVFRNRNSGMAAMRRRLPLLGEVALVGPCNACGSKVQRKVRTSAFYGGQLRGVDVVSGSQVLGCSNCTLS